MPMSKSLKNIIFVILFFYTVCVEEKFVERTEYFKPFISVPTQDSFQQIETNTEGEDNEHNPLSFTVEDSLKEAKTVKCMYFDTESFSIYDISGLTANSLDDKNDEVAHTKEIDKDGIKYTILFNFCYNLKQSSRCNFEKKQAFYWKDSGECAVLSDGISDGNEWSLIDAKEKSNDNENKNYLKIKVRPADGNQLTYILKCKNDENEKGKFGYFQDPVINVTDGKLNVTLYIESYNACVKADFYFIYEFIMRYKVIFIIILMAFGLFNCLLGRRLSKYTAFILCVVVVTILILIFSQYVLPSGCAEWIIWVMLAVGVILGVTGGVFLFIYHDKVISIVAGGLAGLFLGQLLYNFFGNRIPANGIAINIVFVVVAIGVMIGIAFIFKNFIVIFATSIIGSYCFIRGISLFAGGYPNEITILDLRTEDETEQLDKLLGWEFYLYLSAMVILCGLSIYAQYRINKDKKDEDDEGAKDANIKVVE